MQTYNQISWNMYQEQHYWMTKLALYPKHWMLMLNSDKKISNCDSGTKNQKYCRHWKSGKDMWVSSSNWGENNVEIPRSHTIWWTMFRGGIHSKLTLRVPIVMLSTGITGSKEAQTVFFFFTREHAKLLLRSLWVSLILKLDFNTLNFIFRWPPVTDEAKAEIRHDAILVYGVNEMSTKDVFEYFSLYGPDTLEWIDDCSCKNSFYLEMRLSVCALQNAKLEGGIK